MKRISAGHYVTEDGRYRVVRGWADGGYWCLMELAANGDADILLETGRLRDARLEIQRREDEEVLDR